MEILVERAAQDGRGLVPPQIVTVGRLPEMLYEARRPFAEDLTQQLAWVKALRSVPRERLTPLIRQRPDDGDLGGWLPLGEMLATLHRELTADGLEFRHVLERGRQLATFDEAPRWELLSDVRDRYLAILDGLEMWDRQSARLYAIEHRECRADFDLVLVGAVDLNRATRAMLDQVADRVTALVFAPPELAGRFDEHGCLVPEAWQDAIIDGVFERTEIADGPADQAAAIARTLGGFAGRYAADEIVVGVPDVGLVPWITQRLEECGLPVRYGVGTEIPHTGPGRLLRSVAEFLERRTFAALAALVRHPDLDLRLKAAGAGDDWLTEFDEFYAAHLPFGVPDVDADDFGGGGGMAAACRKVLELTDPLTGPDRTPGEWAPAIIGLLLDVYADCDLDQADPRDRSVVVACEAVREAVDVYRRIPAELAPRINGAEVIGHVLRTIANETVPAAARTAAIELVGWLELPLDDAPALVVAGFNEGFVPSSLNADAFLPNELRRCLALNDNARRYARDAYALSLLANSRRALKMIAGRRTAEGDPLVPSRLLFAGPDDELPHRVLKLFSPPPKSRVADPFAGSLTPGRARSAFEVPRPTPLKVPVPFMRVTEFSEYLKCPYRYYLRRHLKLEACETSAEELDGGAFGGLMHDVLERFGQCDDVKSSTRPEEIMAFLNAALDLVAGSVFTSTPLPAVGVQLEQVRLRLKAFAEWQAGWAAEGWRIACTEQQVDGERAFLLVDGVPMLLRGRIDRIDVRETSRGLEFVVFDYKTGDAGRTPEQTHRQARSEWVDLQLPLYRHLVRALDEPAVEGAVRLGYILLPRDVRRTGAELAEWTAADLEEADRVAHEVVRAIRREVFWPLAPEAAGFDEFAAICQEQLLGESVEDADVV
ncbi:MAG TPA: PD-(D/E)XK nuclease family protein [Planctomycetaceae bacterium]|nr:PD-(D/E)XK nuclease family protein [Planctomycetaceae bacterium]